MFNPNSEMEKSLFSGMGYGQVTYELAAAQEEHFQSVDLRRLMHAATQRYLAWLSQLEDRSPSKVDLDIQFSFIVPMLLLLTSTFMDLIATMRDRGKMLWQLVREHPLLQQSHWGRILDEKMFAGF
jgi:hypothetical protein